MNKPLAYEKIKVRADRIELLVRVCDEKFRLTNADLIAVCEKDFPLLSSHACYNEKGTTFGAVMNSTSVPHLLEHLIVYLEVLALNSSCEQAHDKEGQWGTLDKVITGSTQWSADDNCLALVSVSFFDDIVALSACNQALEYLNEALCALSEY